MSIPERDYCYFIDHRKYNRNIGCRKHDNAYGINGGGSERDRWRADMAFYRHMRGNGDPMALPSLIACLTFGWFCWKLSSGQGAVARATLAAFCKSAQMSAMTQLKHVSVGPVTFGNDLPFVLISGPCQIESRDHALFSAENAARHRCESGRAVHLQILVRQGEPHVPYRVSAASAWTQALRSWRRSRRRWAVRC